MKGRWLGVDWGSVRIGLALTDPLGLTAQPLDVLKSSGIQKDLEALGKLVDGKGVTQVVIGLPLNMDGTDSSQTRKVREFAWKLAQRLGVPVLFVDERLSSAQAGRAMTEAGAGREAKRGKIDQVAASLLLRSALDGAPLTPVVEP